jgi:hypothetical protein
MIALVPRALKELRQAGTEFPPAASAGVSAGRDPAFEPRQTTKSA